VTGGVAPRSRQVAAVIGPACTGCGGCLLTCPERAIRPARSGASAASGASGALYGLAVLASRCTGCGDCAEICPADAIVLQEVR
jgi:formate hydrogenlyase subunit 6/NADH:ubiquinone oxidoreductase subunit I